MTTESSPITVSTVNTRESAQVQPDPFSDPRLLSILVQDLASNAVWLIQASTQTLSDTLGDFNDDES